MGNSIIFMPVMASAAVALFLCALRAYINRKEDTNTNNVEQLAHGRNPKARFFLPNELWSSFWTPYGSPMPSETPPRDEETAAQSRQRAFLTKYQDVPRAKVASRRACEQTTLLGMIQQQESMLHDLSQEPFWPFSEQGERRAGDIESGSGTSTDIFPPLTRQGNIYRYYFQSAGEVVTVEHVEDIAAAEHAEESVTAEHVEDVNALRETQLADKSIYKPLERPCERAVRYEPIP